MWDLSCRDWESRLREGRSLVPDLPLFAGEAELSVRFFDNLRLPDVPGQPLLRDAAGDWFRDGLRALFGSRDPETNVRHIRELFWLVGKGNSKTSYGAGLMMTALLMNTRPRAEFLFVGPTQAIADLAYAQAAGMVEADPELLKRFQVREHVKEIKDRLTKAKLKVKTFDLNILTGPKPAGVLLDELHLLGPVAATGKVLRQIRGGLEKMTEGFLAIITTQSDEPPAGAFKDELMIARGIRDGRFPGRMLPLLYEYPDAIQRDQEAWQDPAIWSWVMPNLGRSLQLASLVEDWTAEQRKGEKAIRVWASQHLNVEIGIGLKSDAWAGASFWDRQAEPGLTLDAVLERCEVVVVGIDGGGLDDLLGLAVLGRERNTRRWLHWSHTWAHRVVLERRKSEAARLQDFEAAGELTIVDEMGDDVAGLADIVEQIAASGLLPEKNAIGVDPVGITDMIDALEERGIRNEPDKAPLIIGVPQGWKLNNAINTTGRRLVAGTLVHAGQAITNWAAGNCKAEARGSAITINKQTSGAAKIDPMIALFNAVALMSLNPGVAPKLDVAAMIA